MATGGPQRLKDWGYLWTGTGERYLNQTLSSVTMVTRTLLSAANNNKTKKKIKIPGTGDVQNIYLATMNR